MIKRPTAQQAAESSAAKQSVAAAEGTQAHALERKAIEEAKKSPCAEAAKTTAELVNLASPQRTTHILTGDATGGGHLFPGAPGKIAFPQGCLLYTSPSPRDGLLSRMPSSA